MTDNPLMVKNTAPKSLEAYCQWLNGMEWVRQSGEPYKIAERQSPEGELQRYLTR